MKTIKIANYKTLELENIVLDYNGTIAKDGKLKDIPLKKICSMYNVFVITADTFGSVKKELSGFDLEVVILKSQDHTKEKADFINTLDAKKTASMGNGNNDCDMLKNSALSVAIIGDEGCSTKTLLASDIVCNCIQDAIDLLLNEKRLIATLRK